MCTILPLSHQIYIFMQKMMTVTFYAEFSQRGRRRWPTIAADSEERKSCRINLRPHHIVPGLLREQFLLGLQLQDLTITNALDAEALAMDDIREAVNDENYKLNTEQFKR
ncbi:PREDICTED: uncharacterized protein LOC105147431 [Acromyrmex echinatior]|uniref:uncharacterized protein LOC105147431 n=1 Tax=Acromyrmex echinatior TaxID=103372 RepID=UPI000580E6F6|nr:PREDICTED: uncharacterized protein LOC105147431 [Acromyrmex echinatior]XP_011056728.1 PREDICTED: uncharacterized protein LOC105147431 [Acromyrmex echinatior]XP_011056729.1 PREDICTED: uncharacterized protein LOC105147431 [Acromyrmex echinatior]